MSAAASLCALASVATAHGRGEPTGGAGDAGARAAACSGPQLRQLVVAFVAAFNGGSATKLDALWTRVGFREYSVTRSPKERYVAYGRAKMLRYFAARHKQSEKLVLKSFKFNGVGGDYGDFRYTLTRQANDVARGARESYIGEGSAVCIAPRPRLAVWSMGRATPGTS